MKRERLGIKVMKPSGIGGQAVIEGVMMKNQEEYAVAVRKPDHQIEIKKEKYESFSKKHKIFRLPIFRGMLAFVESMKIGMSTLSYSASFFEEEEASEKKEKKGRLGDKAEGLMTGVTILFSVVLAVSLFVLLPTFLSQKLGNIITSSVWQAVVEGIIRIVIFLGYILLISQMNDIKRVFMYHGAEHKTINCIENGFELTVENVRFQSRQHKRCGTSFLLIVMFFSILFFIFIRIDTFWLKSVVRILMIPIIAGVSYEFIRLAGRSESKVVNLLSKPGLWLQGLTTREPDDSMIEVAIASVEAVFDWRSFLAIKENKKESTVVQIKNEKLSDNIDKSQETSKQDDILDALDEYFGK